MTPDDKDFLFSDDQFILFQEWCNSDFWDRESVADHFETPSSLAADAVAACVLEQLGTATTVVEVGAGDGHLLRAIARARPGLELVGVDRRPAPAGTPARWLVDRWDVRTGRWHGPLPQLLTEMDEPVLLVAVEWLDDLPCPLFDRNDVPAAADRAWLERWWPEGIRREVGRTRDEAWAHLAWQLPPGSTLATLEHGHLRSRRPANGSFRSHLHGREQDRFVPGANPTAAVAMDSVAEAVERLGWQQIAFHRLRELPGQAAGGGLPGLALRSQWRTLRDPDRFGDFWWLVHRRPDEMMPR